MVGSYERRAMCLCLHQQGFTYQQIGYMCRVSPQRVHQYVAKAKEDLKEVDKGYCDICGNFLEYYLDGTHCYTCEGDLRCLLKQSSD